MPWMRSTATDFVDLMDQVNDFLVLDKEAGTPAAGGGNTGDGVCFGASANVSAVDETWTVTATSATNFTVVGSVTGALAAATVNVPYVSDYICFTLIAGPTPFVSSDVFTVAITTITPDWAAERAVTGNTTDTEFEYIWNGIGGGAEEIFLGIRAVSNWSTYYNGDLQGFTGYLSGNAWDAQPGYQADSDAAITLSVGSTTFYVVRTTRMVQIIAVIGSQYIHSYQGYFDPLGAATQYPYPLALGGNTKTKTSTLAGAVANYHNWWANEGDLAVLYSGGWTKYTERVWPYMDPGLATAFDDLDADLDGNRDLFPMILTKDPGIAGQFYNVFAVTNKDSAISVADSIIDTDLQFFLVVQNNGTGGSLNIAAVKLE